MTLTWFLSARQTTRRARAMASACAVLFAVSAPLAVTEAQDIFAGRFEGDGLTLVLRAGTDSAYAGEAEEDGVRFVVEGRAKGTRLEGTYSASGVRQQFRAMLEASDRLVVLADGERYVLRRIQPDGQRTIDGAAGDIPDGTATSTGTPAAPTTGATTWWTETLSGQRLVRLGRAGTSGGASQNRSTITLCRDGRAGYQYTFSMAVDVGSVFGNSSQRKNVEGRWEVRNVQGAPNVVVMGTDGLEYSWVLSMQNERIHLDGNQYLRDQSPC